VRPGQVILRVQGACDLDPERLLDVFVEQRQRFVAILRGFTNDDWAASTRCADWSAQDVVRHLCDANTVVGGNANHSIDVARGFDPRTTPREWLRASDGESPADTLARFVVTTEELVACGRERLAEGRRFDVALPYGPMDWTVLALHGFWDSWIHERDVLLARGAEHPTDGDATFYATAYGVFIAAVVASMFGQAVDASLELGGGGGGCFDLARDGVATVTAKRTSTGGPVAATVADALAGRGQTSVLAHLPGDTGAALSQLADFMNTPAV
jgi:uncharacterized protein (TIGR03083 family)